MLTAKRPLLIVSAMVVLISAAQSVIAAQKVAESATRVCPLLVGSEVPKLELRDLQGEAKTLAAELDGKPTAIVFYRGGWCPFCNLQLGQLQQALPQLRELGVQVVGITPDPPGALRAVTSKFELEYSLLSDSDMAAAKAFGVAYRLDEETIARYQQYEIFMQDSAGNPRYQLPVPAVFLVNSAGLIEFSYVNPDPRVRIEPELLLVAARGVVRRGAENSVAP